MRFELARWGHFTRGANYFICPSNIKMIKERLKQVLHYGRLCSVAQIVKCHRNLSGKLQTVFQIEDLFINEIVEQTLCIVV